VKLKNFTGRAYPLCYAGFIGETHCHTDEIASIFAFLPSNRASRKFTADSRNFSTGGVWRFAMLAL